MFELPGRSIETVKIVEPINEMLQASADKFGSVSHRRAILASEASTVNPAGFQKECGNCDRDELVAMQQELAALVEASSALPTCVQYYETELHSAEAAFAKAEKAVETQLRKAGFAPEDQPAFAANPSAANQRFQMMVRNAESVRAAQAELNDANENLRLFRRMIQHDLPERLKQKQDSIEAWARKRIFT